MMLSCVQYIDRELLKDPSRLYLILIYPHADCLRALLIKCSKQPVCVKTTFFDYVAVIYVTFFQMHHYLALCYH